MFNHPMSFDYCSRRAREEEIASINATNAAACAAHRSLSRLHMVQALRALLHQPPRRLH